MTSAREIAARLVPMRGEQRAAEWRRLVDEDQGNERWRDLVVTYLQIAIEKRKHRIGLSATPAGPDVSGRSK